jgi:hypothetical protein
MSKDALLSYQEENDYAFENHMRRIVNNPELTDIKSIDVGGLRNIPMTTKGRFRIMNMVKYIMDVS